MTITADAMKQEFAKMGFTACPLSDLELSGLILAGLDATEIYSVGCDVGAGFPLSEALPAVLSEDERFFWDHAGYVYLPETETKDTGRARTARQLATAEIWLNEQENPLVGWEFDYDTNSSEFSDERPAWRLYRCVVEVGTHGEALNGIDLGRNGSPETDPYARVVVAELAEQVRERCREETAREARETAYREAARAAYADDELQIDEGAAVTEADGGAWVAAWVWVADEEEGSACDE